MERLGIMELAKRDSKIIAMYKSGKTIRQVGINFGMTYQNVYRILRAHGCQKNDKRRSGFQFEIEQIRIMRTEGMWVSKIGEALGISTLDGKMEELKRICKDIPLYGSDDIRKCTKCGLIGDKSLFIKAKGNRHKLVCIECKRLYNQDKKKKMEAEKTWNE